MRIKERRFSVPFAILDDDLPDKARWLLVFLFSRSDFNGACSPGYKEMRKGAGIRSDNTIAASIRTLQAKGWILHIKHSGPYHSTIWLQIPPRLRPRTRRKPKPKIIILPDLADSSTAFHGVASPPPVLQ